MEFFKGVNVDWMGKAKYFVTLSLVLLAGMGLDSEEWRPTVRNRLPGRHAGVCALRRYAADRSDSKGIAVSRSRQQHHSVHQRYRELGIAARRGDRPRAKGHGR